MALVDAEHDERAAPAAEALRRIGEGLAADGGRVGDVLAAQPPGLGRLLLLRRGCGAEEEYERGESKGHVGSVRVTAARYPTLKRRARKRRDRPLRLAQDQSAEELGEASGCGGVGPVRRAQRPQLQSQTP